MKPGQTVKRSGQYEIIGPRGGRTGQERTLVKNETVPPTPNKNQTLRLVDPTKNKSGMKK